MTKTYLIQKQPYSIKILTKDKPTSKAEKTENEI